MDWLSQIGQSAWRWWAYLTEGRTLAVILGVGFALLAILLFAVSKTRWGQSKPLTKCVVLSVLAHVWLLMYALGNRSVLPQGELAGRDQSVSVSFDPAALSVDAGEETNALDSNILNETELLKGEVDDYAENLDSRPMDSPQAWEEPLPLESLSLPSELLSLASPSMLSPPELLPAVEPTPLPSPANIQAMLAKLQEQETAPELASEPVGDLANANEVAAAPVLPTAAGALASPPAEASKSWDDAPLLSDSILPLAIPSGNTSYSSTAGGRLPSRNVSGDAAEAARLQIPNLPDLPREYALRQAADRLRLSSAFGNDADSEAAVNAGLIWLAGAQSSDGAWNAKDYGGGTETMALGERRYGAGEKADTGVSGLALLAFLSAGHTHLDGDYQQVVGQGLRYLIFAQMPSGDLSGPKQIGRERGIVNARMYCHAIATLALAEAYAMTKDSVLREPLLKAAQYSINAQDPRGGGWRYMPGDPGDLSLFGWQAMALKSISRSGIAIPASVEQRMRRFLDACSTGPAGGLARYKPGEGRPSETMTAEALACRLLLDYPLSTAAQREATQAIMDYQPRPNRQRVADQLGGQDNVYFWYYATLALFQLQDENWREWNQALKARLLETQRPRYADQPGSWDPDAIWGGYGGRVYSTAMSCLCLEVYYRYLPMYQHNNMARTRTPGNQR